ncbi:MAG TPA: dipeptide ABC transporter ATP-binding protein [Pseudogracilibacillus sp.]|nr:dipeptide ABC transporter ATP-binding protein [Pseudogracilibacillus sp.]
MNPLLKVENLKKYFPITGGLFKRTVGYVKAVEDISLTVNKGETVGIVGESGCGKSTTGRMVAKVMDPTEGNIYFNNQNITNLKGRSLKEYHKNVQMIFQDPYASLNPRMTVENIIGEPLEVNKIAKGKELTNRVNNLLSIVGLQEEDRQRYPHEFSGGQRQRIGIARALALDPQLIVADEVVSALDVSVQSQILNLLTDLKQELDLAFLFISHDLSVIRHISDKVAVMYLGNIVEVASKKDFFNNTLHPYSKALLSAAPEPVRNKKKERIVLEGEVPDPSNPPKGCPFHTRCPLAMDICKQTKPSLEYQSENHAVACHLY